MRSGHWFVLGVFLANACGGMAQSHSLARTGADARGALPAVGDCARSLGKESMAYPDAVHVKLGEGEWLYFRVNVGEALEMVVHSMNEGVQPSRLSEMKAVGDTIWACARGRPFVAPLGRLGDRCEHDADCSSRNCAGGACQDRDKGSACEHDIDCDSRSCTSGRCQ